MSYYKRFPDENPEWDDYRERMQKGEAGADPDRS